MKSSSKTGAHNSGVRVVIFDLGGVILHFSRETICKNLAARTGLPAKEIYPLIFDTSLEEAYDMGLVSDDEFHQEVCRRLEIQIPRDAFRDIWEQSFTPVPGMESVIAGLSDRLPLYLLSNTNSGHFPHCLDSFPVLKFFQAHLLSYELKSRKPREEIYQRALEKMGIEPEYCLFIDDRPENLEAAQRFGIRTHHFQSVDRLRDELRHLDLPVQPDKSPRRDYARSGDVGPGGVPISDQGEAVV